MKKIGLLGKIVAGFIVSVCLGLIVIYSWSSIIINRTYDVTMGELKVSHDTNSIRIGERLTRLALCARCHGENFAGKAFHKIEFKANLVAPNITEIIFKYSDEELERLIRHGIKKNGKAAWMFPAGMYKHLEDESVAQIIAYLRTLKPVRTPTDLRSSSTFYPLGRLGIIIGKFKPDAATINHQLSSSPVLRDTSKAALGKYLTMTVCSGCHGQDLKGNTTLNTPDLVIASAYTENEFRHLLKTGEGGLDRRDLGIMSSVSKDHLKYLADDEIHAMYLFLQTLKLTH
jgi:cytochrome c553